MEKVFKTHRPDRIVHLAAQAGVRYSLENPYAYIDANVYGFLNILENCRHVGIEHLVYASTSSVYGSHTNMPFPCTTTLIIRSVCTPRLKNPMN